MRGLMAERQLLISALIRHAARYHGDVEVVSRLVDRSIHRYTYAEAERRSRRLAKALLRLGIGPGRPGRHAGVEQFPPFRAVLRRLRHRRGVPHDQPAPVRRADRLYRQPRPGPAALCRGELCSAGRAAAAATAGGLPVSSCSNRPRRACRCSRRMTSWSLPRARTGSTGRNSTNGPPRRCATRRGRPAGRKASSTAHRSTLLHAYAVSLPDGIPASSRDAICPVVPMFHACGWSVPYYAPMNGVEAGPARPASRRRQPVRAVRGRGGDAEPRRAERLVRLRGASERDRRALLDVSPHPVGRLGGAAVDVHRVRAARHRGDARAGA